MEKAKQAILDGTCALGIEFGSTRIKGVLIDETNEAIAVGNYDWENTLLDGRIWSYSMEEVRKGLQGCYAALAADVEQKYGVKLTKIGYLGISGMMHGYIALDENGELLVPFRTWRNTITGEASEKLTELFHFHIPQRWSIAHLYQAILNGEEHVKDVRFITTLAGYVHWKLTGRKVVGNGEASGMFPIDLATKKFDEGMIAKFNDEVAAKSFPWKLGEILPEVLVAGEDAGSLTAEGAKLLDPTGTLQPGAAMCPPEGDAGTGMVATNSVAVRTGNVSAGTSVFAMVVLEKALKGVYDELDIVTTPVGDQVAMVHCNNCTSDLNAWVNIFKEFQEACGQKVDMNELYGTLYRKSLEGDPDCGGLLAYNYFSGEHITGLEEGRPLFVRRPDDHFSLANFMRANLFTSLGALKIGLDILLLKEGVKVDEMRGHGGLFKTEGVGQRYMAAAVNAPVSVMKTASEGGAWGIALLAMFLKQKGTYGTLADFLNKCVFADAESTVLAPDPKDVDGFNRFIQRYQEGLAIEKAAVEALKNL